MKKRALKSLIALVSLCIVSASYADTPQTISYQYDDAGRLTNVSYAAISRITYDYDTNGNMVTRTIERETPVPFPGTPSDITAKYTATNVVYVSWTSATNAVGYNIWQAAGTNAPSQIGSTTNLFYTDTVQSPLIDYYYWVLAFNTSGTNTLTGNGSKAVQSSRYLPSLMLLLGE
ncbi:MAG: hypothetical protein EOL87_17405 [Spartobacteria bacterium]|nr:hypothetical protein [Spartobacteria bacterium]